jgi:hypothetical protein
LKLIIKSGGNSAATGTPATPVSVPAWKNIFFEAFLK